VSNERSLTDLEQANPFAERHIGPAADDQARMLDAIGYASMDALLTDAIPASIREKLALALPPAASEAQAAAELRALADRNDVLTSMIGLGYYDTLTPAVIRRCVLENPAWYTATRRTSRRSARVGSRRCSTSRPWSRTSPGSPSPARPSWTRGPPQRRRWRWRTARRATVTR
jgi:hypothetical protein